MIVLRRNLYFTLAALVLLVAASALQMASSLGWVVIIKKALPIRKPLCDLDRQCVAPLAFVTAEKLSEEMEAELGTKEYADWVLNDPAGGEGGRPVRVRLSVTYYTGKVDQVPHVPEECLFQGGMDPGGDDNTLGLPVAWQESKVPIRRLSFRPREAGEVKLYDYYTICVNNKYFANREAARWEMSSRASTHLFYSKVEVMYVGLSGASLSELDERAFAVVGKVLAELTRTHYPLKGWEQGGPPGM